MGLNAMHGIMDDDNNRKDRRDLAKGYVNIFQAPGLNITFDELIKCSLPNSKRERNRSFLRQPGYI